MLRRLSLSLLVLSLPIAACSSTDAPVPVDSGLVDSAADVADSTADSTTDTVVIDSAAETITDSTPETMVDSGTDTAKDSMADAAETTVDSTSDVATDTATDGGPQAGCLASGGTVGTMLCCASASDFPNLCTVGPCGCAPSSSKSVKVCNCPSSKCFDGTACK